MRLFVAIDIDGHARIKCGEILRALRESGADIRATSPGNLHLTLKFLGEVREDDVKMTSDSIREALSNVKSFTLGFSELGYFGRPGSPRVVWLGIREGIDAVMNIIDQLNDALPHVKKDDREARPHMTLARVKSLRNSGKLLGAIRSLRDVKLNEFHVKEIKLKKSILRPEGPVYSDIGVFELEK